MGMHAGDVPIGFALGPSRIHASGLDDRCKHGPTPRRAGPSNEVQYRSTKDLSARPLAAPRVAPNA